MTGDRRSAPTLLAGAGKRSVARLATIQALYQIDVTGATANATVSEFLCHRQGAPTEGESSLEMSPELFTRLVLGISARREEADALITGALSDGWSLGRLERLLLAVLRAGTYELLVDSEVPARVVIDEYVEVARAFFGRGEPGLVNGVLDRLARDLRPAEFATEDGVR